jgi:hypothetical protein
MAAVNLPAPPHVGDRWPGRGRVRLWERASQERDGPSPRAPPRGMNVTALGNVTWHMIAGRYAGCKLAAAPSLAGPVPSTSFTGRLSHGRLVRTHAVAGRPLPPEEFAFGVTAVPTIALGIGATTAPLVGDGAEPEQINRA